MTAPKLTEAQRMLLARLTHEDGGVVAFENLSVEEARTQAELVAFGLARQITAIAATDAGRAALKQDGAK